MNMVAVSERINLVVGVSDMKISSSQSAVLVTHSLGSCLGVAAHDPVAGVGGLLHFQLPLSAKNPMRAQQNPFMFADTGFTAMFEELVSMGASKKNLTFKIAGGACVADKNGLFNIGQRNYVVLKKLFWKNQLFIAAEDVGGDFWRNMKFDINTGRVWIKCPTGEYEL